MEQVLRLYNRMLLSVVHKNNSLSQGGAPFVGSIIADSGTADGTGSNARFSAPSYIVADGDGNFYVSDVSNHTIRKVTQYGVVTTVFGTAGTSGSSLTTLNSPRGLALDASNNLYIADFSNNRVLYLSNGGSTASNVASVPKVEEVAVNSNGTQMVFRTNATSRANLIQYRNGTLEGTINTVFYHNFSNNPYNIASVACSPDGNFYYCSRDGQFINQIGMYKMTLSPPTTYNYTGVSTGQTTINGSNYAAISLTANPLTDGVTAGQTFTLSGFSTETRLNAFVGTVVAAYGGGYPTQYPYAGMITFKFQGFLNDYPTGAPNFEAYLTHSEYNAGSNYRILAVGWDTIPVSVVPDSNLPASPEDQLRMNFYLKNVTYGLPSIPVNTESPLLAQVINTGTLSFGGFTGEFTSHNSRTALEFKILDFYIGTITFGGPGTFTTSNYMTGTFYTSPVGGFIFGPNVEPGTLVTSYNSSHNPHEITTNKPYAYFNQANVSISLSLGTSAVKTFSSLASGYRVLVGMRLVGPNAPGVVITSVTENTPDVTSGTITLEYAFESVAPVDDGRGGSIGYTLNAAYEFAPWPGGSTRLVSVVFQSSNFPSDSGGKCSITVINNPTTAQTIDGALYGSYLKNIQFPKTDSDTFAASSQNYGGIRRYGITDNTIVITDSNAEVPNLNPFALFPTTSDMIALVPTPGSNNIQIYQNVY